MSSFLLRAFLSFFVGYHNLSRPVLSSDLWDLAGRFIWFHSGLAFPGVSWGGFGRVSYGMRV